MWACPHVVGRAIRSRFFSLSIASGLNLKQLIKKKELHYYPSRKKWRTRSYNFKKNLQDLRAK